MSAVVAPTVILPLRDGDPDSPSAGEPGEDAPADEILRRADALGIPWRRLLLEEVRSEERWRRYLPNPSDAGDLDAILAVLGTGALRSWRVRDRLESLAMQARTSVRGGARRLRAFVRGLAGASAYEQSALSRHLRFAYERVLLLQRVRRAAARSRGTPAERLAFVCATARCAFDDAEWALREETSPRRGRRMEAAVRKVRDEGFCVPRATSEALALADLRRLAATSPRPRRRGAFARAH